MLQQGKTEPGARKKNMKNVILGTSGPLGTHGKNPRGEKPNNNRLACANEKVTEGN